jgi:hypothetical protein
MSLSEKRKMKKMPKQEYTAEFKEPSVKLVNSGQTSGAH